jgi:hypothetical protein
VSITAIKTPRPPLLRQDMLQRYMFTAPLPGNDRIFSFLYSGIQSSCQHISASCFIGHHSIHWGCLGLATSCFVCRLAVFCLVISFFYSVFLPRPQAQKQPPPKKTTQLYDLLNINSLLMQHNHATSQQDSYSRTQSALQFKKEQVTVRLYSPSWDLGWFFSFLLFYTVGRIP